MIHVNLDTQQIEKIKKLWCQWFFREEKINQFINVLDNDDIFRKMVFTTDIQYNEWKLQFELDSKAIKDMEWRETVCGFFFDELSNEKKVVFKYKKAIQDNTKKFLLKNYENYRKSSTLSKIINIMKIEVCPYCNRNFLESYVFRNDKGIRKYYFKGDLDHHYSKDEIPSLTLSFYNLVPSCKICNHEKLESTKRTFYPFFDIEDQEYHFSIELYNNEDKRDIIYDKPIENIENKRFDSTVWQGISNNFNIRIRGVGKTELNECMENSNEVFRLEKKYNHSKEYVKELIRKKYIYPETHIEALLKNFGSLFKDESDLLETFYSYSHSGEDLYNRPLSKLTKDVLNQIGILKDEI